MIEIHAEKVEKETLISRPPLALGCTFMHDMHKEYVK